jgi:cobalt-zinc-cadmium efflux system membrane fusion protein
MTTVTKRAPYLVASLALLGGALLTTLIAGLGAAPRAVAQPAGEDAVRAVKLDPSVLDEFDIEMRTAEGGHVAKTVRLPGEVVYNADRIAEITPPVSGIATRIHVSVGDDVQAGQTLAVLSSRELAAARSEFRAAEARLALAEASLERAERMYRDKVGTEQAVLEARNDHREAEITLREAETALHAVGLDHDQIDAIEELRHGALNEYELVSPLDGVVTERRLTIGEVVEAGRSDPPLIVADLSTVWVNLTVYQRDLAHVRAGQRVTIECGQGIPDTEGTVAFVSPSLDEETRTAFARIVLSNPDGQWKPGLFVDGVIETGREVAAVVVPRSALTRIDEQRVVFVRTEHGFEPRHVRLGRMTEREAAVVEGLEPGERYAASNVLALKTQLDSGALEHAGHAH